MMGQWLRLWSSLFLFLLVFGMSATVDLESLKSQCHNRKAVSLALGMQFIGLPAIGFAMVRLFRLDSSDGLILLVVVTSPGGSYSNWMCSMFNADLALSVFLTAVSTVLSCVLLPLNLLLYAGLAYGFEYREQPQIDWSVLIPSVLIVILGVTGGVLTTYFYPHHTAWRLAANRLGNSAGAVLMIVSAVLSNSNANARLWDREYTFYIWAALPSTMALVVSHVLATHCWHLPKPEVVTVAVESCYQNVGIALSMALSSSNGDGGRTEMARAMVVPFYYGIWQAVLSTVYCTIMWKTGSTKAPVHVSCWNMLTTSYEVHPTTASQPPVIPEPNEDPAKDGYVFVDDPNNGERQHKTTATTTMAR
jgi:predicted Na+-dependent transporter